MTKSLNTGGEIDSFCTKCKILLNHRIIAMVGNLPVRVECSTCSSHHNYRPRAPGEKAPKAAKAAASPRATKSGARPVGGVRAAAVRAEEERIGRVKLWEKSVSGKTPAEFRPYGVSEIFSEGDLVRHNKFGDGIVTRILDSRKVEILFQAEPKTLAQGLE